MKTKLSQVFSREIDIEVNCVLRKFDVTYNYLKKKKKKIFLQFLFEGDFKQNNENTKEKVDYQPKPNTEFGPTCHD